jgi:hypothetical protein
MLLTSLTILVQKHAPLQQPATSLKAECDTNWEARMFFAPCCCSYPVILKWAYWCLLLLHRITTPCCPFEEKTRLAGVISVYVQCTLIALRLTFKGKI